LSASIEIGVTHSFYGEYEPATNGVIGVGGNGIESSQFKYGIRENQNLITQIVMRTDGEFQWYDFIGLHVSATVLTNVIPATCGPGYWVDEFGSVETNLIASGYQLVTSAQAHEIDDYGFYGASPNAVYVASDAWIPPNPVSITCPPSWFDRGQTCESDGTWAFLCEMGYSQDAGNIHESYSTSGNTRSGLAVGIARPEFVYH